MRISLSSTALASLAVTTVFASDAGVPLRPSPNDYAVQGQADTIKLAAAIIPPKLVSKIFSPEIAKRYMVVEIAIYPQNGLPFDVESSDFALRVGQRVGRADKPLDVDPWPEAHRLGPRLPVDVAAEVGVAHESGGQPGYGPQHSTGTYTGVGVSAPASNVPPPSPDPRVDPRIVAGRLSRMALAEGDTRTAIAGYLYFPQYQKHKKTEEIELKYAKDVVAADLLFPGKP
jgi:hypothetical protein